MSERVQRQIDHSLDEQRPNQDVSREGGLRKPSRASWYLPVP